MNNPIKICFVIPGGLPVPAVKGGAIETLITQLVDYNERAKNFEFTVVSVKDNSAEKLWRNYELTNFVAFGNKEEGKIYKIVNFVLRAIFKIFKIKINLLKQYDKEVEKYLIENGKFFDLIINESSGFYNFKKVAKVLGKEKIAAHLHCYVKADRYLDSYYGNIITVSDYIKRKWLETSKINEKKIFVLKNGIDVNKFQKHISESEKSQLRKGFGFGENDFVILYCGRIVPVKGIRELILSVSQIESNDVKLLIVGSPNFALDCKTKYLKEVEDLITMNKDKISFTGFIQNEFLYKYYDIADVSVIPSIYEDPAPLVPIESMAAGKPTIITNTGGAWEYVTEECSIKVIKEENIIQQLKDNIILLKQDREKLESMSKSALEVVRKYDEISFYNEFSKVIRKILN